MMKRALVAGLLLGAIAGLVLVNRGQLRLSTAWPVILGFALWDMVGERGSRGIVAALTAGAGATGAYATFVIVGKFMPITDLSVGIVAGVAIGGIVIVSLLSRGWIPVSAPLIGYGAFFGAFEPQWRVAAANLQTHGLDVASVVGLGLVVGCLSAAVVRWVSEASVFSRAAARLREAKQEEPTSSLTEVLGGGGGE